MVPNRLVLYRKPLISKTYLHYITVYAIGSGGYIDSGEENQFHLVFISDFWGIRPHGRQTPFSSKQNSLHMVTPEILLHPFFTTTLLYKGRKGKGSHQNKLPNMGMAKLSSSGSLGTPGRVRVWNGKGPAQESSFKQHQLSMVNRATTLRRPRDTAHSLHLPYCVTDQQQKI